MDLLWAGLGSDQANSWASVCLAHIACNVLVWVLYQDLEGFSMGPWHLGSRKIF